MSFDFWKRMPPSWVLFLFFFSIYAFTMSGTIQYGDEIEKYRVAQSLVERQEFSFRPTAMRNQIGIGGRTYSIYELGQTVVEAPLYALGLLIHSLFPTPDVNWMTMLFVGFLNPLLTALTCVVLFRTCASLGFQQRTALILAVVFGLGTIALPYSRSFTREPLLGLFILLTFYAVHAFSKSNNPRWLIVAGASAGYLVFSKFIQAAVVPFFVLYILTAIFLAQKRRGADTRSIVLAIAKGLALFSLPVLLFMGLQSIYALTRFGTLYGGIAGTRGNPFIAIFSLLSISRPDQVAGQIFLSPEKSIFLYSPPALLFLVGWFRWLRLKPMEAGLCAVLVLIAIVTVLLRSDGDGGSWWGLRYLVQITPLLIIPIGALLELPSRTARGFWTGMLVLLSGIGLFVSAIGALTSDRDYLDIMGGIGTHLNGQIDFLRHGALDSLVLSLSPAGFPLQINSYGVVLLTVIVVLGAWIVAQLRSSDAPPPTSPGHGVALLVLVLAIEFAALITWIVAPYSQVLAAKGDTKFVSGNLFLADSRKCEATAMYLMAIERGTQYQRDALARLDELLPLARGTPVSADELMANVETERGALVSIDERASTESIFNISGDGALRFSAALGQDASASATTDPMPALPNTTYEISGWMKTENVYGSNYGVVEFREDNGRWGMTRGTDLFALDETNGWRPFRKTITTLPTTQRIFLAAGLWKTYGTVWVDKLQIAQISPDNPPSAVPQTCP